MLFSQKLYWGIQTNIFETNIINLAKYSFIAIVIFFVGDALKSLLSKRQESIFSNLQQANQRAIEMKQKLLEAQTKFENASKEVQQIKKQAENENSIKKQENKNQIATNLQRLKESTVSTIYNQQQKIKLETSQKIIDFAINKVLSRAPNFTQNVQKSVNKLSITSLKAQKVQSLY
uniref:ATP synthase subunit b, chloroplastic n=1 Tax=Halimeda micronesica TaxID=170426 RepID=A0A386AXG9_9CHLO|nr:ATP synthase CF0 subunit I [Halimeda micronesica]